MSAARYAEFMRQRAQHLGFLRVLCRDEDLAEELFQDLAVAVLEGMERYQPEAGAFDAWVRGIARNLWRGHLRQRRPTCALDEDLDAAVVGAWDDRDPLEAVEQDERLGRLRHCVETLAPGAREILQRRYERRESSRVIAAATGRTCAAIDTALTRIRRSLLACIEGTA